MRLFFTLVALGLSSGLLPAATSAPQARTPAGPKKLAVLPLRPASANPATDHLGPALAHEIATRLMSVKDLVVREPKVVRMYAGRPNDPRTVAHEVDAEFLLTGSYVGQGRRISLSLELMDIAGGASAWRETLDVSPDDLGMVASTVPTRVVEALKLSLSEEERRRLRANTPSDGRAYDYYLRALATAPVTAADWAARSQLLERSSTIDPGFAPAFAALGDAYLQHAGLIGGRGPYYQRAEDALRQALRLDGEFPVTLKLLGSLDAKVGKSEESAELLHRALEINPNSPAFHAGLGYIYRYAGLMDESVAAYQRAQALDASLANLVSTQGQITKSLIYQGVYPEALASQHAVNGYLEELDKGRDEKQMFYEGVIHYYAQDMEKASALFDESLAEDDQSVWSTFGQAYQAAAAGDVDRVLEITDRLESRNVVDGERRYRLAHFYALIGEQDAALRNLEASIESGFFNYPYIASDPLLESLRTTRDWELLLERAEIRHSAFRQSFAGKLGSN